MAGHGTMKCEQIREQLLDLAQRRTPEQEQHLAGCAACASELDQLRGAMALLDEWKSPEPSPYFDARLRARLREQASAAPGAWWKWLRAPVRARPAAAFALALLIAAAIATYQAPAPGGQPAAAGSARAPVAPHVVVAPDGSAVADLQALEKNQDLYADFDLLDTIGDTRKTVNP